LVQAISVPFVRLPYRASHRELSPRIELHPTSRSNYSDSTHPETIMEIAKITKGDNWELMVPGRIDGAMANQLEVQVLAAIKGGAKEIFINLSQAEWMCSAAIRVILQYYRQMKNNGKTLLVTRPSAPVSEILEMTGFKDVIVEDSRSGGTR
jgi:anti-sigma B factor antagonist